jgi:predicted peroxiredoxin
MINPTGNKLEKILFGIFDKSIENADRYNHNKSLWLIFTNDMKWVVEYTDTQTLWYNYQFFKNEMELVGLDCVTNKDLIQKWFETRFLNTYVVKSAEHLRFETHRGVEDAVQNGVKHTSIAAFDFIVQVEDTIQNGVKDTAPALAKLDTYVEDIIQNGVKHTKQRILFHPVYVEDTIQNGVKETQTFNSPPIKSIEDIIQNGVIHTQEIDWNRDIGLVKDTIKNGVKKSYAYYFENDINVEDTIQNGVKNVFIRPSIAPSRVEDTIKNGVKVSKPMEEWVNTERIVDEVVKDGVKKIKTPGEDGDILGFLDFMLDNNTDSVPQLIDDVIINGVKETQPLPAQDGNMDWGNYYHGKEDRTKPFNEYLDEAIRFGVKETYDDCSDNIARVEDIIRVGKKINQMI